MQCCCWGVELSWNAPQQDPQQVGPFSDVEQAARVHDVSVLKLHASNQDVHSDDLNFPHAEYDEGDLRDVKKLSPSQFLLMLDHYASVRCDVAKQSGSRYTRPAAPLSAAAALRCPSRVLEGGHAR